MILWDLIKIKKISFQYSKSQPDCTGGRPGDRPGDRSMCMRTCTWPANSAGRPCGRPTESTPLSGGGRSTGRSTVGCRWSTGGTIVINMTVVPVDRAVDRKVNFDLSDCQQANFWGVINSSPLELFLRRISRAKISIFPSVLATSFQRAVSYTHLTLPTIYSV